jgi:hypothetical protein
MDKIIETLLKDITQKVEVNKNISVNHDEVAEMKKDVTMTAKIAKMQFDQFVAVGFTEEQAIQMVIAILN